MTGATSDAYCAATLWKAPHGIPVIVSAVLLHYGLGKDWLTAEHLARNQHMDVGSEEQGKNGSNHHDQETYGGFLRTVPIGDPTSDD